MEKAASPSVFGLYSGRMKFVAQKINGWLRRIPSWPLYILGPVPALLYFYWGVTNQLGADPLNVLERQLGKYALQLLILTLLVTPLRQMTGISLLKFRRAFGLMAFFYVIFHLLTWVVLDKQFYWSEILADLTKRPYIIIGMLAFTLLIPLALTSNRFSIRRLGPLKWGNLHKLSYIAVVLGAIHYLMLVKSWPTEPVLYVVGAIFLVLVRLNWARLLKLTASAR